MPNQTDPNQAADTTSIPPISVPNTDLPPLPDFMNIPTSPTPPADSQVSPTPTDTPAMPSDLPPVVATPKKKFGGSKIIATILGLVLLVGGIGAGVVLTQQQQLFQQKASDTCNSGSLRCSGNDTQLCVGGQWQKTSTCSANQTCSNGACVATTGGGTGIGNITGDVTGSGGTGIGNITGNVTTTCSSGGQPCQTNSNCCSGQDLACNTTTKVCEKTGIGNITGDVIGSGGDCAGVGCNENGCSVGDIFDSGSCYVNHYWCETRSPGGCSSNRIHSRVSSSSLEKDCGTEQIDIYCKICGIGGDLASGLKYTSKTYDSDCSEEVASAPMCIAVKAYDPSWSLLTSTQLSALSAGAQISFCVSGSAPSGTFDKAQFTINGVQQAETTTVRPGSTDFCQSYTILSTDTTVGVTAKIHHSTLGWY